MHALIIALACLAAESAHAKPAKPAPRPRTERQLIVVEESQRAAANAAAVAVAGPRAANTFAVKYEGTDKKTYYAASWMMTAKQRAAFEAATAAQSKSGLIRLHKTTKASEKLTKDLKLKQTIDTKPNEKEKVTK